MARTNKDPLGYYKLLGVSPSSSSEDIKKAYKHKAMELHPDRNQGKDTTKKFQELQAAFNVLSDSTSRAQYDLMNLEDSKSSNTNYTNKDIDPIVCCKCGCVSAQPRYVIFYRVVSILIMSYKTPIQGIYCSDCASKAALTASAISWFAGWWGIPWGPIWTIEAIYKNLMGGEEMNAQNATLLYHQSSYFYSKGNKTLGKSIALDALELITKSKKQPKIGNMTMESINEVRENLIQLLAHYYKDVPSVKLKDQWGPKSKLFLWQILLGVGVVIVFNNL